MRDHQMVLATHVLADRDGVAVRAVRCRHPEGPLCEPSVCVEAGVVLVRRGCFVRESDGHRQVLDPSMAYLNVPGAEERFAHPHAGGDDCTVVRLDAEMFEELFVDAQTSLAAEIPLTAQVALSHRLLFMACDERIRVEMALELATDVAEAAHRQSERPGSGQVTQACRRLVSDAREALAADSNLALTQLALLLSVSSHHLSRTFSRVTGRGVARHRVELRICAALDRLQDGEDNFARLAADLGFADQAHLTRTLREHTRRTPSELRVQTAHENA